MEGDKELDNNFSSEASTAEAKDLFEELLSRRTQLDDSFEDIEPGASEECSVEELTEWAKKEKLGSKFINSLVEIVNRGGLRKVTEEFLENELLIRLPTLRGTILAAIKLKLTGNKKARFGDVESYEPVLTQPPKFSKCLWMDLADIEERHDKVTLQAALTTWRFCATGIDGKEEDSLKQTVFDAWKPKQKGIFEMFQDLLDGVGAFFVSMPCCCREKPLHT
mmetsp:Transcript_54599/g.86794  ORF Transcript_54599/g.86794 Transcript_54599/m.86794 type:complete len:222 (-) Transcript_54599:103-768(-)